MNEEIEALKQQARKALADYLNGEAVEIWISEKTVVKGDGSTKTTTIKKNVARPTPQWVIEMLLNENVPSVPHPQCSQPENGSK